MSTLHDVKEVAKILNVSPNTVRKWVSQRRIPFVKVGTLVKFKSEDIEKIAQGGLK